MERGYCLSSSRRDQNAGVKRLDSLNDETSKRQTECLQSCRLVPGVTGCELIWGQRHSGCYAHTREVALGSGVSRHICWILSKCRENRVTVADPGILHFDDFYQLDAKFRVPIKSIMN